MQYFNVMFYIAVFRAMLCCQYIRAPCIYHCCGKCAIVHAVWQSLSWFCLWTKKKKKKKEPSSFQATDSGLLRPEPQKNDTEEMKDSALCSVWRDGASAQAATRQALEDAHGDVHERAEIEQQVVKGVHRQATSLIRIL